MAWGASILFGMASFISLSANAGRKDPPQPAINCAELFMRATREEQTRLEQDREFMKNLRRDLLRRQNPLNQPENTLHSILNQLSMHLPPGTLDSPKTGDAPFAWEVEKQEPVDSGRTLRITVFNSVLKTRKTLNLPWDPFWQARFDYWNRPILGFKNAPSFDRDWNALKDRLSEEDYKLEYESSKSASASYRRGAEAAPSVLIDLLVNQLSGIRSRSELLPQYLWFLREQITQVTEVLGGQNARSLMPFFSGPYGVRFPGPKSAWPLFTRNQSGVEMLTAYASELSASVDIDHSTALEAFAAFLSFEGDRRPFNGISNLHQAAYALNMMGGQGQATYGIHYLDWPEVLRLQSSGARVELPRQYLNAPEDLLKFVLSGYRAELGLTAAQRKNLDSISKKVRNRSRFVFLSDEPSSKISRTFVQHPLVDDWTVERLEFQDFDHFTIQGAMSIVESKDASEPLPIELFTQAAGLDRIQIERKTSKPILEIGRFYVNPDRRPFGPRQIWTIVLALLSKMDVEKVVAETTKEYAEELIAKFGFKKLGERANFEGKLEYVIEASPENIFEAAFIAKQPRK